MPDGGARHRLLAARAGELARHGIEHRRAPLALARDVRLQAHACGQAGDDQRDRQHDREADEVLDVADGEGKQRRHEEEVECSDRQNRGGDGRTAAEAHGDEHDGQQVDHGDVHQLEHRAHQRTDCRAQRDCGEAHRVARPTKLFASQVHVRAAAREEGIAQNARLVGAAYHKDVDAFGSRDQLAVGRRPEQAPPQRPARAADDDARDIALLGVVGDFLAGRRAAERHRLRAERLGEPKQRDAPVALLVRQAQQLGRFDIHDDPAGVQRRRHALAGAHQALALLVGADRDQQPLAGRPGGANALALAVFAHRGVDAVRGGAQRQLAQRDEVALAEEILDRVARLLGDVHLARLQPLEQHVGRRVDHHHLVGALEHAVRNGFLHAHAGDPGDDVVQALDVLHVDRGMHGNARLEELLDVLPALGMPRPRLALERIAVRELVDEQGPRLASKRRVEVEVAQRGAAVSDLPVRQPL